MKLALARTIFKDPDILFLNEPTNYLDVKNVKWLKEYFTNYWDILMYIVIGHCLSDRT